MQEFYSKAMLYENRILPYNTFLNKKNFSQKIWVRFSDDLVNVLLSKDPDPGGRKVPDPQHCLSVPYLLKRGAD